MEKSMTVIPQERQFAEVVDIIVQHRSHASRVVNEDTLLTAWHVGGYVSRKLKSEEWGSKVVTQLSEYIRSQRLHKLSSQQLDKCRTCVRAQSQY